MVTKVRAISGKGPSQPLSLDMTIRMNFAVRMVPFKKRAPRAIKEIKLTAQKWMLTEDVRIDPKLNKFVWNKGVRFLPKRVRVRMVRKRTEDEDMNEKFFTVVQYVPVESFKGLQTEVTTG
eukprot:CAMPEP_0113847322 /NCGR_PEP_ID=MMETSP0372-20130328/1805_1 /TAXON_ID=340204 /ORGANISM="Lankesteria abbotti" /LENGTH=120 /DNA_ID=CAMNT_0000816577 /DNA_START=38 /DNA_END=400 /DNA_ORIENTATION=+ /assembly_acc=CAM_ASM_000359